MNRGGLFPLDSNTFSLFIEIEKNVHVRLPKHMIRGESDKEKLKKSVIDVIADDDDVQFYWVFNTLSGY